MTQMIDSSLVKSPPAPAPQHNSVITFVLIVSHPPNRFLWMFAHAKVNSSEVNKSRKLVCLTLYFNLMLEEIYY